MTATSGARLRVMSFNVRYDEKADGRHAWRHRRDAALALIREHDPDLLGLQEAAGAQWADITTGLTGYSSFSAIDDEGGDVRAFGGFYRTERFSPRGSGVFWLSDTPSVPDSMTWPNDWGPRACGWTRLHDRAAGREIVFANTHFDTNAGAWLPSAEVLHAELDTIAGRTPLVVAGDFNCAAGSEAHEYLRARAGFRDAWTESGQSDDGTLTYHGFLAAAVPLRNAAALQDWLTSAAVSTCNFDGCAPQVAAYGNYRIDWILMRGPLTCLAAAVHNRDDRGVLPSDHYPVVALLEWSRQSQPAATIPIP